jgi:hypothetical protein
MRRFPLLILSAEQSDRDRSAAFRGIQRSNRGRNDVFSYAVARSRGNGSTFLGNIAMIAVAPEFRPVDAGLTITERAIRLFWKI